MGRVGTQVFVIMFVLNVANSLAYNSKLERSSFPDGFLFGAGSSAYQIEGAVDTDGKKPSIWDTFTAQHPEKISDHSNGDVAEDFYHRFQQDILLMKEVGLDSYRFSISWPRILPEGDINGGVNWEGVKFYNRVIDELLAHGIKPFVTLFHWDVPQALENKYGGFGSQHIVTVYCEFADFCFNEFGDRVRHWTTLNEPNLFSQFSYAEGLTAPGRCSSYIGNCSQGNSATEPYIVVHHLLLAHANAVQLYRQKYQASQGGIIGIIVSAKWYEPKYDTIASRNAASRALDFFIGWIIEPLTFGRYPETMRYFVGSRLPNFTQEQAEIVKGSFDFIGINYYTANYAENDESYSRFNLSYTTDSHVNLTTENDGIPIGEPTDVSWLFIYPKGLYEVMLYIKEKYNNPTIYITENGMADNASLALEDSLNDTWRINYHYIHLSYLLKSIKEGLDVRGYFIWSFMDDFEWSMGYTVRFGLTYIDYNDGLKRYLKRSAFWFKSFLQPTQSESFLLKYSFNQ